MPRAVNGLKECASCHVTKAVGEFYGSPSRPDGLYPYCKECHKIHTTNKLAKRRELGREVSTEPKKCRTCKAIKMASEFTRHVYAADGLMAYCKACASVRTKANNKRYKSQEPRLHPDGHKTCCGCQEHKPVSEFRKNRSKADHLDSQCGQCRGRQFSNDRRLRLYGISTAQYLAMLESQNHLCYLCHQPETLVIKGELQTLAIDHCHKTANPNCRGLICNRCNISISGLEYLFDNILLERAIEYLGLNPSCERRV